MKKNPVITIWKDHASISNAAAHLFLTCCRRTIATKGKFIVALSGGNTPKDLYQLLASPAFSRNIPWHDVYIFWSDERFVPHTDQESNYRMVKEFLLDLIEIPAENIFPVPFMSTAKKTAKKYEETICGFFKKMPVVFDLILLGIGTDGHTASIFPGSKILKEKKKLVMDVSIKGIVPERISFTLPLLNSAAGILFLVSGEEKAAVIARMQQDNKINPSLPAQQVKPKKGWIYLLLDEDAAGK